MNNWERAWKIVVRGLCLGISMYAYKHKADSIVGEYVCMCLVIISCSLWMKDPISE